MIYLQEVNIEFEAYSISDNDYGGIKKLLQQVWSFQNLHACLLLSPFLGWMALYAPSLCPAPGYCV